MGSRLSRVCVYVAITSAFCSTRRAHQKNPPTNSSRKWHFHNVERAEKRHPATATVAAAVVKRRQTTATDDGRRRRPAADGRRQRATVADGTAIVGSRQRLQTTATAAAPTLYKAEYAPGTPVYITVDTSLTGIGWVVNQEDEDGTRFPIWFGAKVLSE